jgi:hypothetical protein
MSNEYTALMYWSFKFARIKELSNVIPNLC